MSGAETLTLEQVWIRAVTAHTEGRLEEAEQLYGAIVEAEPEHAPSWHHLGVIAFQAGQMERAAEFLERSIALEPNNAESQKAMGKIHHALNNSVTAERCFDRAALLAPDDFEAHFLQATVLMVLGRSESARPCYLEALRINPDDAEAQNHLGVCLHGLGEGELALARFHKALELNPDYAEAYANLALLYEKKGLLDEAEAVVQRALQLQPGLNLARSALAMLFRRQGRADEAIDLFEQVLKEGATAHEEAHIHQQLGKLYDRKQESARAFEHFAAGNRLQRAQTTDLDVRKGVYLDLLDHLDEQMHEGWLSSWRVDQAVGGPLSLSDQMKMEGSLGVPGPLLAPGPLGRPGPLEVTGGLGTPGPAEPPGPLGRPGPLDPSEIQTALSPRDELRLAHNPEVAPPVFLVGFPRSGTTLLDQILDSHPDIQVMEEKPALGVLYSELATRPGGYLSALAALSATEILDLRKRYVEEVNRYLPRGRPGLLRVDKMPLNLVHAPLIARLFPEAPIILALRHPCDAILSGFMQRFVVNDAMAHFFSLEEATELYCRSMAFWRRSEVLFELKVHPIRYESVVADFNNEVHNLLTFLDVPWDDAVLAYDRHALKREITTPSYHQVTRPIYTHARYRWRRYESQMAETVEKVQPFIEAFGYGEGEG
ncbi:MAG: sulfotransferase [Magnetococcales bacterium]|nr:sulfotransferase [Magnetococcales bacterium]